jgi:hypothetical protein
MSPIDLHPPSVGLCAEACTGACARGVEALLDSSDTSQSRGAPRLRDAAAADIAGLACLGQRVLHHTVGV